MWNVFLYNWKSIRTYYVRYIKEGGIYKFDNKIPLDFKGEVIYPTKSNSRDNQYNELTSETILIINNRTKRWIIYWT